MSDSGESDVQTGDIHGHQTPRADTGALLSVHVDNVEVSRTEDNEEEVPEPGDQDNNRRRLNRRVDSAVSEQVRANSSATIDGLLLQQASRRQKRPTGPRRMNTAPVNGTYAEAQPLLPAPNERVEGIPVTQQSRDIRIEHVAVCGLCQGKSMEDMWLQGGSLQMVDVNAATYLVFLMPRLETGTGSTADFLTSPFFASGMVFLSGFMDTLFCQAFYNSDILRLLKRILVRSDQMEQRSSAHCS